MPTKEISEQLDILLGCDEQLQFVTEVLQRAEVSGSSLVDIYQQIDRIKEKEEDPNLYMAVIGEFSSGKSTFINALLRDDLLKTSSLVATAVATKIVHGSDLRVEAHFSDPFKSSLITQANSNVVDLPWLPNSEKIEIKRLIQMITSEEEIAKDVVDIQIEHPALFLSNGITIIDTPGTNADNSKHAIITQQVVQQKADLAIIIIPAITPLSQSLADFLSSSLKPYLHRCIFIVSRIDQIPPNEVDSLLSDLRSRLAEKLDVSPPILHSCSAQVVLDMLDEEESVRENLQVWQEQFITLEKALIEHLSRQRTLSIAESLLRLLSQLLNQLNNYLQSQWQEYETRQIEIKRETIPNLPEFTAEQYAICERKLRTSISTYLSKTTSCVDSHRETVSDKIRANLFGVTSDDGLKDVLQSQAQKLLTEDQGYLQRELQPLTQKLAEDAITVGTIFDQKFSDVYRRLQSIGGKLGSATNTSYAFQANVSNVAISAQSLTQKLDSGDGTKMGVGATAGLLVGSFLLPGVGSIVGLAVGTWASRFFMPSLDERKQKLWEQLRPSIDSYFDEIKIQAQNAATTYTQSLENSLKQRIDSYIRTYKIIIDEILSEQNAELQRLTKLQKSTQTDLTEIERRQQKLIEKQQKLAKINS